MMNEGRDVEVLSLKLTVKVMHHTSMANASVTQLWQGTVRAY